MLMNGLLSFATGGAVLLLGVVVYARIDEYRGGWGLMASMGLLGLFCIAFAISLLTGTLEALVEEIKKGRKGE
jgi:ABC-type uncharacterized transport system permease subunit